MLPRPAGLVLAALCAASSLPAFALEPTTTALVRTSPDPGLTTRPTSLVATVTAAGEVTGLVEFFDGAASLGTRRIRLVGSSYEARYSTTLLSVAGSPHTLTARYLGDANLEPSDSGAVSQSIRPGSFSVVDIGNLGGGNLVPWAISRNGIVVGRGVNAASEEHAFSYTRAGGMVDLGPGNAFDVNDTGDAIGLARVGEYHAFLWSGGDATDLGTFGHQSAQGLKINAAGQLLIDYEDLGNHRLLLSDHGVETDLGFGAEIASATALNSRGEVTGQSNLPGQQPEAFLYTGGLVQHLGTLGGIGSIASDVNDFGEVVGYSRDYDGDHAFSYVDGSMHALGTLGGTTSDAFSINDAGQIAGYAQVTGNAAYHAFRADDGVLTDLGTLGVSSFGFGINAAGDVIGRSDVAGPVPHAFLHVSGAMMDIQALVPTSLITTYMKLADTGELDLCEFQSKNPATRCFYMWPAPLVTAMLAPAAGIYGGSAPLTATLTDADGAPVVGKLVTFRIGGVVAGTATTDASGVASASVGLSGLSLGTNANAAEARFLGDDGASAAVATADVTIAPSADLSIAMTAAPDPVAPGTSLLYSLHVANAGPNDATSVTVTDAIPAGLTFVSGSPACASDGATITCTLGALAASASQDLALAFTVDATTGPITNAVSVTGAESDPQSVDNDATVSTEVHRLIPTISWAAPAAITYGTPLGDAQLAASSDVVGSMVYTPPAGTLLGVGAAQSLSVTFTPDNAVTYETVIAAVTIDVLKAPTTTALARTSPEAGLTTRPTSLVATVTPTPATAVSGLVEFFDGATSLGTRRIQHIGGAYEAHYATTMLSVEGSPHTLTARYLGDANLDPSDSGPVSQSIRPGSFSVVDIGNLGRPYLYSQAMSPSGILAGFGYDAASQVHAFRYARGTGLVDLGPGYAHGVNDAGDVIGSVYVAPDEHVVLYSGGTATDLGAFGHGTASGDHINASGQLLIAWGNPRQGFILSDHGVDVDTDVGPGAYAIGLNARGEFAGSFNGPSGQRAFLYSGGSSQTLDTVGGAWNYATDLNDLGEVVGNTSGPTSQQAFLYAGGVVAGLGTLGGSSSWAQAMNNAGQITGQAQTTEGSIQAFRVSDGVMTPLLTSVLYSYGQDINAAGDVLGIAQTPAPEYKSYAFLHVAGAPRDVQALVPSRKFQESLHLADTGELSTCDQSYHNPEIHCFYMWPTPLASMTLAPASGPFAGSATLTATLTDSDGAPVAGKLVSFSIGDTVAGTATTDAGGIATASVSLAGLEAGTSANAAEARFLGDDDASAAVAHADVTVVASADVAVTQSVAPATVVIGNTVTFSLLVTNNGPSPIDGATVTDTLPANAQPVSASGGCSTPVAGVVTCAVGPLAAGESATLDIGVRATTLGTVTNQALVAGADDDPIGTNNATSADATVVGITVNTAAHHDDGACDVTDCTLYEALALANSSPGLDTIGFDIPGANPHAIGIGSGLPLPVITEPVVIDATTQPGYAGTPVVDLQGSCCGMDGLSISAGGSTVRGLSMGGFNVAVRLTGAGGNVLEGNFLGTDPTGLIARLNGIGLVIESPGNRIGGATPTARNIVSGNFDGIEILGDATVANNVVEGNIIGADITGAAPLPNYFAGVAIFSDSSNNVVGGTGPGSGNVIAFNQYFGVVMFAEATGAATGNGILGNSFFSNGSGIALSYGSPAGNHSQAAPVLGLAATNGASTTAQGTLASDALVSFRLEFFANPTCEHPPFGEGKTFLGFADVATDAGGNATFTAVLPAVAVGQVLTATATHADGSTSQFSACQTVVPTAATATLGATSLAFGDRALGSTSAPQSVTITNNGGSFLNVASRLVVGANAGDFVVASSTCGSPVPPGSSCAIGVTFTPTAAGARGASLQLSDDAADSPQLVSLTGNGVGATLSFAPAAVSFGNQFVRAASVPAAVTVTNTGNATASLSSIATAPPFSLTTTCGASLAAGASCTIGVTFSPTVPGPFSGAVTVVDDAFGNPHGVALDGRGSNVSVTPTKLVFADQLLDATASAKTITLKNTGPAGVAITGVASTSPDFTWTSGCPATLAPKASCAISVRFVPTGVGTRAGAIVVGSSDAGSPLTIAVTGAAHALSVAPTHLSFSTRLLLTTSAPRVFTLTNHGTGGLPIPSIAAVGDFAQTNDCGASLPGGASCSVSVTFRPTSAGTRAGSIEILDDDYGGPHRVLLSGTGSALALSPGALSFGLQRLGSTSGPRTVSLSNLGDTPIAIASTTVSADWTAADDCAGSIPAGGSCTLTVRFAPTTVGNLAGTVSIVDGDPGGPHGVSLTGRGYAAYVTPVSVNLGSALLGTTTAARTVTLHNDGPAPLTVGASISAGFTQTNDCTTVAAGGTCAFQVRFTPSATGIQTGSLTLTDGDPSSPQVVALTGRGQGSISSLLVSPRGPTILAGDTLPFTATAKFPDNTTEDVTSDASWGSSQPAAATVSNAPPTKGVATAVDVGTATISAQLGGRTGSSVLTVRAGVIP